MKKLFVEGKPVSPSTFRKRIIKNLISTVLDKDGKLTEGAFDKIEKQYIRQAKNNDAFEVHRTTRRAEINDVLIKEGFL